ncbi:formate dehydrogenase accessory sulfurtransferase FdhD [bacterium]|nr:formate dehydrogenase accessory sulfurtransferase FdhD [candidate division CSSED10-310 bacterium]
MNQKQPKGILFRNVEMVSLDTGCFRSDLKPVIKENLLLISLDGKDIATLKCLPVEVEYLALGFLYSSGILTSIASVHSITSTSSPLNVKIKSIDPDCIAHKIYLTQSANIEAQNKILFKSMENSSTHGLQSNFAIDIPQLRKLWELIKMEDAEFRAILGVSVAILCSRHELLYISFDINHNNSIDRIAGRCFSDDISMNDKFVYCSGRFSSENISKLSRIGVPIIISSLTPTNTAIDLADTVGITLLTTSSAKDITIYTHSERVTSM